MGIRVKGLGTVSYTHLDVYKRQDLNISSCTVNPQTDLDSAERYLGDKQSLSA